MGRSPELFNSGYDEYFKIIYSGYYEWLSGAREYVSSAESALLREWCMRLVQEGSAREYLSGAREWCTRLRSGARVAHETGARGYVAVHE